MSRKEDRWRLPALERFGSQLREAERKGPSQAAGRSRPRRWRTRAAALALVLALGAAAVALVSPAGALSPINHAPTAAAQSGSVRFSSSLEVAVNGRQAREVSEQGALDFATGNYETTLNVGDGRIERRRVGTVFYGRQRGPGNVEGGVWRAIRIDNPTGSQSPPGGGTLIDPQVVFRVLAGARSPVTLVGREQVDGVQAAHYHLSTTLAAFLESEQSPIANIRSYQGVPATLDVWLDDRGRPERVEVRFAGRSRVGEATMRMILEFRQYGLPVIVQSPPGAVISRRTDRAAIRALGGDPVQSLELLLFRR